MQLPEPYFSPNRWIAQVDTDKVIINPMFHNKGKFLVVGWNPLGQRCALQETFDTPELAQIWIESLDPQTQSVDTEHGKATVFLNLDGKYWWYSNKKYHQLYLAYDMNHAINLVKSSLESLADSKSPF